MVKRILLILILLFSCVGILHGQNRQIKFRVTWVNHIPVDSTAISVFINNDTIPVLRKIGTSPDTIALPQPNDTTRYTFRLQSYWGTTPSIPATAGFYFDAVKYFKLMRWITPVGAGSQCHIWMFNDSSFTMRDSEFGDTLCVRYYNKLPQRYLATGGQRARLANSICTLFDPSRNIQGCSATYINSMWDSYVGPPCKDIVPGQKECTLLTTVMDYDSLFANRYTPDATCQNVPLYDWLTGSGCVPSGWVFPTGIFPGRWETASNYIIFKP